MSKVVKFYEFGEPDVLKLEEEPLRIERQGNLAVEVGRQKLVTAESTSSKNYKSQRKYTHVLRKTEAG